MNIVFIIMIIIICIFMFSFHFIIISVCVTYILRQTFSLQIGTKATFHSYFLILNDNIDDGDDNKKKYANMCYYYCNISIQIPFVLI